MELADAAEGPSGCVLDHGVGVLEGADEESDGLVDVLAHGGLAWAFKDGAEGHGACLAEPPVLALDVLEDEGHDNGDDIIFYGFGYEVEARRGRHRKVPDVVVEVRILVLLREALEDEGDELGQRGLDVVHARTRGLLVVVPAVLDLLKDVDLLVAESGPELEGLRRDLLLVALDGVEGEPTEDRHVVGQLVVVVLRNLHDALISHSSDLALLALCRLAYLLHDHVPLRLVLHVAAAEEEGIAEGRGGGVADFVVGAIGPEAIHDGREDVVRHGLLQVLVVEPLAGVAQALQSVDLVLVGHLPGDVLQKGG
mmetsp:Transcript_9466/g.18913  ORF Transcript_9466/g.18913 Transcript_9466/m.18913 type:complete len:311 (-) Transcript_9466:442-1374(-)